MSKNNTIEKKWLIIKTKEKDKNRNLDELDYLTCDLIAHLAQLTDRGIVEIEGIPINKYKDRVWLCVERLGLLPEYRSDEEELEEEVIDDWESYKEEDNEPVYDEDQIAERIKEDEAHNSFYSENL